MNFKIAFVVFGSFLTVSIIFYFYIDLLVNIYDPSWQGVQQYDSKHDDKKTIFIIGSSSVYSINSTYVQNYILENDKDYEIYNLAFMSDLPSTRLKVLHNIISNHPQLVVYGIGLADFKMVENSSSLISPSKSSMYMLNPHSFFVDFIAYALDYDADVQFPSSPKDRTILLLKYFITGPEYATHPFINFKKSPINDYNTIKALDSENTNFTVDTSENNKERLALQQIVTELHQNEINVVVFSNPNHRIYLDGVSDSDKAKFELMLQDLSKELNVDTYFLHEKYADLNIWRDSIHVAVDPSAKIYSEDIAKIILDQLEK